MNRRQWKKACKKAATECERRWPGVYIFVPSDGSDTVYAPRGYEPPRSIPRWLRRIERRYATPPPGTPLLVTRDYWGEVDIETALDTFERHSANDEIDWEAIMRTEETSVEQQSPEPK